MQFYQLIARLAGQFGEKLPEVKKLPELARAICHQGQFYLQIALPNVQLADYCMAFNLFRKK